MHHTLKNKLNDISYLTYLNIHYFLPDNKIFIRKYNAGIFIKNIKNPTKIVTDNELKA
ncbi:MULTISPECIES: hypothetical protein [unclassified Neisseria]|uniref:hypothetical protein n=1 Tax=unclassified Neisseria TaxID=2623750 RepID=UPI00142F94C6|nr:MULTISPECIES: hypothetical protein [unclassified Neisseria]MBF0804230.1 hypothetical protein [Neisseria sp. 19428wB4_WF04]